MSGKGKRTCPSKGLKRKHNEVLLQECTINFPAITFPKKNYRTGAILYVCMYVCTVCILLVILNVMAEFLCKFASKS